MVTTWRDTTSEHVQSDLDRLLNTVLPFADEMLRKHGEFYPYGAAITREGEEQVFAADPGETEDPNPSEVLTSLVSGMSERSVATVPGANDFGLGSCPETQRPSVPGLKR